MRQTAQFDPDSMHICISRRRHAAQRIGDFRRDSEAGLQLRGLNESGQERAQPGKPKLTIMPFGDASEMNQGAERVRAEIGRARQIEHQMVAAADGQAGLVLEVADRGAGKITGDPQNGRRADGLLGQLN